MFPDTMYPEIYFWGSAFFLLQAFLTAQNRQRDRKQKALDRLDYFMYAFVELGSIGASLYFLYLGSLG